MLKKEIAFFDFDGTITVRDTLLEFIKFSKGRLRFYYGFLWNSPYLVAYKLKLISNQRAKERMLCYFFQHMLLEDFTALCTRFHRQVLSQLIRPGAMAEIDRLKGRGVEIVIVSASPEYWIQDWAAEHQLQLIGSELEVVDGKLTGNIKGINCHGDEKVRRIIEKYHLADYETIYAYGDTAGDKPMLQLATQSFYKPFRS